MTEERRRGVDLFNEVWRLMETREDNAIADPEDREHFDEYFSTLS